MLAVALPKPPTPIRFNALRRRREELSQLEGRRLTQEDIAERTGDALSQRTISHLEAGSIELGSIAAARLAALARALKWNLGELQEATGIDLGIELPSDESPDIDQTPARPLSPNLVLAAEMYGKGRNADFDTPRWLNYLNNFDFADGREPDPEGWLEIFQTLRRANVEPGEN